MKTEVKIGFVGVIALVALFLGINFLKGVNLFKSSEVYYITFSNTKGLSKSSSVYADGYKIICLNNRHLETVTPEKHQYAASKGIRIWAWGVSKAAECAAHIAQGITGFQMCSRDVTNSVIAEMV